MSEKKKDLSITIVAYHNYDDILVAVSTLEQYTSKKLDKIVYIVDNGEDCQGTPQQKAFVEKLGEYPDVKYCFTGENVGFGKGHNYVMESLNSKYHAVVNPDIIFVEDAFTAIIDYMDKDDSVGMCIPHIVDEAGNMQKVYRREITVLDLFLRKIKGNIFQSRKNYHTMQDMDYTKCFNVPFGQGSFLVIRTELFKKLNGFDDRFFMYMEDADLCKRVNSISKLMYYPGAKVIHIWEKGSHKNKALMKIHFESMRMYFKKWGIKWF